MIIRPKVWMILGVMLMLLVSNQVVWAQDQPTTSQDAVPYRAVITKVRSGPGPDGQLSTIYEAKFLAGPQQGRAVVIGDNEQVPASGYTVYKTDDQVFVAIIHHIDGTDHYLISDYDRRMSLWWLVGIFVAAIAWFSRWRGVRSLLALIFSIAVIVGWMVPLIAKGYNPVIVTLIGSAAVLVVGFLLNDGFSRVTLAAGAGTVVTMVLIGFLSRWAIHFSRLTGNNSEESFFLQSIGSGSIDVQGLLLAGIIIGTLGILDDIAISQVAVVGELRRANPRMSSWDVYRSAARVGRSHMAAIVNTLVLAYAGSALPLLVLFSGGGQPANFVLNGELVATEIVRSIIGSLGLIMALPITTAMAVWFKVRSEGHDHGHHGRMPTGGAE